MKIEVTYPIRGKHRPQRKDIIAAAKWPFLLAAYLCPILNLCLGGRAWSVVVLWSLWFVWSALVSPTMVEYNRISQLIKVVTDSGILLILIDVLLSPGWAIEVVPIVCFSGLTLSGILFFTDLKKQKQNMLPLLLLIAVAFLASIVGLSVWGGKDRWALVVMGALSLALFLACFLTLGGEFLRELKKRFHTK